MPRLSGAAWAGLPRGHVVTKGVPLLAGLYLVSPLDLVPDVLPLLGQRRSVIGNRRSRVQERRVLARKHRLLHQSRRVLITVIDNRSGRHLLGSWRHDLLVRRSSPKWRRLQVFGESKGCRGAGEWARTTDLLITNKLLRGTVGRVLLIYDAYIRAATAWARGHNSGPFRPMWALHAAEVINGRAQGATREFKLLSVVESPTSADPGDRHPIRNPISDHAETDRLSFWTLRLRLPRSAD